MLEWIDEALTACNIDRRVTPHGLRHTANNELRKVANGEVVRESEKRDAVARGSTQAPDAEVTEKLGGATRI